MISYLVKFSRKKRNMWEWLVFFCRQYSSYNTTTVMKWLRSFPPWSSPTAGTIMARGLCWKQNHYILPVQNMLVFLPPVYLSAKKLKLLWHSFPKRWKMRQKAPKAATRNFEILSPVLWMEMGVHHWLPPWNHPSRRALKKPVSKKQECGSEAEPDTSFLVRVSSQCLVLLTCIWVVGVQQRARRDGAVIQLAEGPKYPRSAQAESHFVLQSLKGAYKAGAASRREPTACVPKVKVKSLSRVWLFATPWTVAYQALPSMGFSRQEYWGGLPFPSPGDLSNSGIEPGSPTLQADVLTSEPLGIPCVPEETIYQRLCPEVTNWRSSGKPRGVRVPKKGELIAHKKQKWQGL